MSRHLDVTHHDVGRRPGHLVKGRFSVWRFANVVTSLE
jgi:hypothetical protein